MHEKASAKIIMFPGVQPVLGVAGLLTQREHALYARALKDYRHALVFEPEPIESHLTHLCQKMQQTRFGWLNDELKLVLSLRHATQDVQLKARDEGNVLQVLTLANPGLETLVPEFFRQPEADWIYVDDAQSSTKVEFLSVCTELVHLCRHSGLKYVGLLGSRLDMMPDGRLAQMLQDAGITPVPILGRWGARLGDECLSFALDPNSPRKYFWARNPAEKLWAIVERATKKGMDGLILCNAEFNALKFHWQEALPQLKIIPASSVHVEAIQKYLRETLL